jgi:WD40 repeat protein
MRGLDFSPDGQLLATIEQDNTIALWDLSSAQVVLRINYPGIQACGIQFSPGGILLASGHVDGLVRLWNAENGELVRELRGLEAIHTRDGSIRQIQTTSGLSLHCLSV